MNRNDWEAQVKSSDLNPTARLVALVLGGFGNWTVDKTVEPGESRVAKEAGLDPSTVGTYVDAFVEQGWLRPVGKGRYNTTIYELCEPHSPTTGILAKTKRKPNPNSRKNLRQGTNVVPERTGNIKVVGGGLVPDTTGFSSRKEPELVPERIGGSSRYHRDEPKEPSKENLEEPSQSPVPDGPVDEPIREEDNVVDLPLTTKDKPWQYKGQNYLSAKHAAEARRQDELDRLWRDEA